MMPWGHARSAFQKTYSVCVCVWGGGGGMRGFGRVTLRKKYSLPNSKHLCTTSWRKVPESDARSVTASSSVSECVCVWGGGGGHFANDVIPPSLLTDDGGGGGGGGELKKKDLYTTI